jgi:glycosyltransferase involved in cell wall biosynthesis
MTGAGAAVVVPVYNRRTTVLDALASVAAQSLRPDRLVVVDDGSTDGTADQVRRWITDEGSLFETVVVCQRNRGVAAARNRGIAAAGDCQFLAFLDSDDIWPADFLERARAALSSHPTAVAATRNRRFVSPDDPEGWVSDAEGLGADATMWLLLHDAGLASASLFRGDSIRRLGGFREDLRTAEDAELFFRLSLSGRWLHVPGEPVIYRRELARSRGEAGNLSLRYTDQLRTAARVFEEFVMHHGGKDALPRRVYQRSVSKLWYRAGRELMRTRRYTEARECFQRSTSWRRYNKAWLRLAQIRLARAG